MDHTVRFGRRLGVLMFILALLFLFAGCENLVGPDDNGEDEVEETNDLDNGEEGEDGTAVTGVSLDPSQLFVAAGATDQLTATVEPPDADDQGVSWDSSNDEIADVSTTGQVAGIAPGAAVITVTTDDGGHTAEAAVVVVAISLDKSFVVLEPEATYTLEATVEPDGYDPELEWKSDDENIVMVDGQGTLTAVDGADGNASVTVTDLESGASSTVAVTVTDEEVDPVTGVTIDAKEDIPVLTAGFSEYQLSATVEPEDATNKSITWSTSDPAVAEVSSDGTVTANAPGTATITVTTFDGGETDTVEIGVIPPSQISITFEPPTGETFDVTVEKDSESGWMKVTINEPDGDIDWFLDGEPVDDAGENITIDDDSIEVTNLAEELGPGVYTLTAVVTVDGTPYSTSVQFELAY